MQGVLRIAQLPDLVYDAGWPVAKVRCLCPMNMTVTGRQTRRVESPLSAGQSHVFCGLCTLGWN